MATNTSEEGIKEVFNMFDKNGDGTVNVTEITKLVAKLGGEMSEKEADLMIKMADADGSGDINFSEFRRLWTAIKKDIWMNENEEEIKEEFSRMDANGDGFVTKEELLDLLKRTTRVNDFEKEAQKCLEDMDVNNDGKVSYEEFLLIWKYRK